MEAPRSEAAPVLTVGFLLLLSGLILLLAGDAFYPSDPAMRSLWTALIGILLLLAGLAYLLLRAPEPTPSVAPRPTRARPPAAARPVAPVPAPVAASPATTVEPAPGPAPAPEPAPAALPGIAAPSVRRAVAMAADGPDPSAGSSRSSLPTSIPAAYLQALSANPTGPDPWSEMVPPIAAALPFSPGIRRSSDPTPPWDESSDGSEREAPRLELELARLRARVRELEVPPRGVAPALVAPRIVGVASTAKEPPTPPSALSTGPRGCVACGTGLAAAGPSHLCWGCGRTLCSTCYWRFGPGPGLHRCPDCMSRAPSGSESISGGRLIAAPDGRAGAVVAVPPAPRR